MKTDVVFKAVSTAGNVIWILKIEDSWNLQRWMLHRLSRAKIRLPAGGSYFTLRYCTLWDIDKTGSLSKETFSKDIKRHCVKLVKIQLKSFKKKRDTRISNSDAQWWPRLLKYNVTKLIFISVKHDYSTTLCISVFSPSVCCNSSSVQQGLQDM